MVPTPFMGNHGEIARLADGSLWEVIGDYLYLYEYYPAVIACPSIGKLMVGSRNINARPLSISNTPPAMNTPRTQTQGRSPEKGPAVQTADVIESQIDGDFEGGEGDTIFKLVNGQIWQQVSYSYKYHYAFMPRVLIVRVGVGFQMQVQGVQGRIALRQLR
jgi:hypothetical protein